jgi:hypothetical protein
MSRLQPGYEDVVRLEAAMVADGGLERATFPEMPCRVTVAGGFGAFQGILDHGPAQQGSGKRLLALERFGGRIQDKGKRRLSPTLRVG